jgi:hypothetical protein
MNDDDDDDVGPSLDENDASLTPTTATLKYFCGYT